MKKVLFFFAVVVSLSVSAQTFFVGDTTCNYYKPNYTFTEVPGSQNTYYFIDLDNDNIKDIEFNSIRVFCYPTPSGPCSSGFDVQYFKINSATNTQFVYGPATGANCAATSVINNMPYASALQASQNWTFTANPYVYSNDLYSFPQKHCGQFASTFYVGFKRLKKF
ncbi:MAG: hypothetical protein V4580_05935 [Bacteroidota bacterium]